MQWVGTVVPHLPAIDGGGIGEFFNIGMSVDVFDCCVADGLPHWNREFAPHPIFRGTREPARGGRSGNQQ